MSNSLFFLAKCSHCSRKNQLEIDQLGRLSVCNFCQTTFSATAPDSDSAALEDPLHYWINFTDHEILPPEYCSCDSRNLLRTPR